jgi:signal transduction histidine kinase
VRSERGFLAAAIVAAALTAIALGAAIAAAGAGTTRMLVAVAGVGFVAMTAFGLLWATAARRVPDEVVVERAETAAKLAHELRNPLMAIKGLASTGVRMFDRMTEDERREFFRLIDEEAARVRRVVDQSAEALAVDADRVVYDRRPEDLAALVEEVAWEAPHGAHPMSVESEMGVTALVDRRSIGNVVTGLIDNAAKYSPPDAPIEVVVRRDEGGAVVEVADRGPGIPLDRVDGVFERFASWRPAGYEETPGAGLGLFLARRHVDAHGGRIDVVDRDEGGTILRVSLPGAEG